jgi:thymidylate synthase ThyX
MTISATIITDSISPEGFRLTTFQLRYPRFIHAELMTHRVFSRNASSSRAIPVDRMIEDLRRDPAMPVFWGSNKPGMQAGDEINGIDRVASEGIWLAAMEGAIFHAESLIKRGLHKQIANRILEPWAHINVVVTATDYENFFTLRRHADAQPEIKVLADAMWQARVDNDPILLLPGQWHLPYVNTDGQSNDVDQATDYLTNQGTLRWVPTYEQIIDLLKKVSVARCARVSYLTHDGRQTTVEEDIKLYERLVGSQPLHASPAEHQATPDEYQRRDADLARLSATEGEKYAWQPAWENRHLHGNFTGWIQYRKTLPNEFIAG